MTMMKIGDTQTVTPVYAFSAKLPRVSYRVLTHDIQDNSSLRRFNVLDLKPCTVTTQHKIVENVEGACGSLPPVVDRSANSLQYLLIE